MSLSCSCNEEWDGESEFAYNPDNFVKMPFFSRRKKCRSCKSIINMNKNVAVFERFRGANCDYEYNRFGDCAEIPLANIYFCEKCSDIFFNLEDLGFCPTGYDCMPDLFEEYLDIQKEGL